MTPIFGNRRTRVEILSPPLISPTHCCAWPSAYTTHGLVVMNGGEPCCGDTTDLIDPLFTCPGFHIPVETMDDCGALRHRLDSSAQAAHLGPRSGNELKTVVAALHHTYELNRRLQLPLTAAADDNPQRFANEAALRNAARRHCAFLQTHKITGIR